MWPTTMWRTSPTGCNCILYQKGVRHPRTPFLFKAPLCKGSCRAPARLRDCSFRLRLPAPCYTATLSCLRRHTFFTSKATCFAPHAFHQPKTHRLWLVFLGCHGKSMQKCPWKPMVSTLPYAAIPLYCRFFLHRESECGNFGQRQELLQRLTRSAAYPVRR